MNIWRVSEEYKHCSWKHSMTLAEVRSREHVQPNGDSGGTSNQLCGLPSAMDKQNESMVGEAKRAIVKVNSKATAVAKCKPNSNGEFIPPDGGWGWVIVLAAGCSNVCFRFHVVCRSELIMHVSSCVPFQ